jgi:hypothetical protein
MALVYYNIHCSVFTGFTLVSTTSIHCSVFTDLTVVYFRVYYSVFADMTVVYCRIYCSVFEDMTVVYCSNTFRLGLAKMAQLPDYARYCLMRGSPQPECKTHRLVTGHLLSGSTVLSNATDQTKP